MSTNNHTHIITPQLLGKGGESEVYTVDDARVLRIYYRGTKRRYIEQRMGFYALLHEHHPSFELPFVLEIGTAVGRFYTVEHRMFGRAFAGVLPALAGDDRRRALASYLRVAGQIGSIRFPERPFGE